MLIKEKQHLELIESTIASIRKGVFSCLGAFAVYHLSLKFNPWIVLMCIFGEDTIKHVTLALFSLSATLTSFGPTKAFDLMKGQIGTGRGSIMRISTEDAELIKACVAGFDIGFNWLQLLLDMAATKNTLRGLVPEITVHLPNDKGWSLLGFGFTDEELKSSLFASSVTSLILSNSKLGEEKKKQLLATSTIVFKEQAKRPSRVYWGHSEGLQNVIRYPADGKSDVMERIVAEFRSAMTSDEYMSHIDEWFGTMEEFFGHLKNWKAQAEDGDHPDSIEECYKEASQTQKDLHDKAAETYRASLAAIMGEAAAEAPKQAEAASSK